MLSSMYCKIFLNEAFNGWQSAPDNDVILVVQLEPTKQDFEKHLAQHISLSDIISISGCG